MSRSLGIPVSLFLFCVLAAFAVAYAAPSTEPLEITPSEASEDVVGDLDQAIPVSKVLQDTIWIADWSFDGPGCTTTGWTKVDNRILNDGSNYWVVDNRFAGTGGIVGKAAILSRHTLCWPAGTDGYGNNWDYSIVLKYKGAGATLSFRYLSDSEPGYDYVTVEADSAGASEARVNYSVNPKGVPSDFRQELSSNAGLVNPGIVTGLALPDFGALTTTHEAYIRFTSDGGASDEDGFYPTFWSAALIVDNISVTGTTAYTENFEGALNANVTLANTSPATPFGEWARLFQHVTDNDKCTENTTCSWLWSDPLRIASFPDMTFGPGSAVVRNWLDDIIVGPWVSLASTPQAVGTPLMFRRFGGNRFSQGPIVQNWSVRSKVRSDNTDTAAPGDSFDCISNWGHATQWNSLTSFNWGDALDASTAFPFDMTTNFPSGSTEIQVRFRTADWQLINGVPPPATINPGPGPYIDRVRIGRRVLTGPVINQGIDSRFQAQDCFPTNAPNAIQPGEHFSPSGADRFGTCAFSQGSDLALSGSPNLITGDSINLAAVVDARGAGGITSVTFHGAITSGPHAGKAPAPYTVGGNGFFNVTADSARNVLGAVVAGAWCVDLDDTYFRGGDRLLYFWAAIDAGAGFSSLPAGMNAQPASVTAAENATIGLLEVSYLPTINWAPAYLARIAADAHGDLAPTGPEIAASTQANCILFYQHSTDSRRSGLRQRTSFMHTLDQLGYRGYYDVYDVQGYGNTNNQLGSRANVAQCSGYSLIIEDDGRSNLVPNVPDGSNNDNEKVNQAQWYRNYLAQGLSGLAGTASLWMVGENTAFEKSTNGLFTGDMGLSGIVTDQAVSVNPDVEGVASFTWASGANTNFTGDKFSLAGGCPAIRAYDAANAAGGATRTHSYKAGATTGLGAIIMNKNAVLKWNTIWQGFAWFDIRHASTGPGVPTPQVRLASKVLAGVLPAGCLRSVNPTGTPDPEIDIPRVTALHQNVPNPFNPTTTIQFDLATAGQVELQVFDVAGHLVRTLASGVHEAGRHSVIWNGHDAAGHRAASGVYFYRLNAPDFSATRKLILLQ